MDVLKNILRELAERFELSHRLERASEWWQRDEYKVQRRIGFACSVFFLALVVLLTTTCSGGPQIQP